MVANRIGQQLGNYSLIQLLGKGTFAEVYLGGHVHLGTLAAIKVLHTQLTNDDVNTFRIEARIVAHLLHPNIVRVLEFGVEEQTPFLVMDFAPHGTLRQHYRRGTVLPLPTIVSYVKQIADALQYAHDERLVHRDVKPENILLGRRNEVLLSDFGIALLTPTPVILSAAKDQHPYNPAGTMIYMAPEQIRGKPCASSDQYSLGIVTYEWLCGTYPFQGDSAIELAMQHLSHSPRSLRDVVPSISPAVEQVVMRTLAKDPMERFVTIQDFASALEQASLAVGADLSCPPPIYRPAPTGTEEPAPRGTPTSLPDDSFPTLP